MNVPFISITLVCYNYAHYLSRTLEAIGRQTFRDFEVVFIDNGSSDNSMEVARDFFDKHPDISVQLLRNNNVDHSNAFGENMAVDHATGKYLMFHDADDWMDDNCLELLAAEAKRVDADRVICAFRDVDDEGKTHQIQGVSKKYRDKWGHGMQQGNLFRRSIYVENGMRTLDSVYLDSIKTFTFSYYAKKIGYVDTPCYNYLVHLDSTSRNKRLHEGMWDIPRKSFKTILDAVVEVYKLCEDEDQAARAELQITKIYYSYLFNILRAASLKEKKENYVRIRDMMKEALPRYTKNRYATLSPKSGNRFYARLLIWGANLCEKLHIMKFALTMYHALSKVFYFPV